MNSPKIKRAAFRPPAFWHSALMTLPDSVFFDLMRSALGNIKTPFNKQRLLEDLSIFLSRQEIQETIAAFIDEDDRRIIAAIALLGEPVPGELESFFSGEYSYAELHGFLLNLEERLIVYRFREENRFRIALNPRLEPVLAPIAQEQSRLFFSLSPGTDVQDVSESPPLFNDRILAALFAFFLSCERLFKPAGSEEETGPLHLKKKWFEEGKKLFPALDLEAAAGGFEALGILSRKGDHLAGGGKKLDAFRERGKKTRLIYLAAGIALYLYNSEKAALAKAPPGKAPAASISPYLNRALLRNTTKLIYNLFESLDEGRLYPRATLVKHAEILRRAETGMWDFTEEIVPSALMLEALEKTGLLQPLPADSEKDNSPEAERQTTYRIPAVREREKQAEDKALIAFDSPSSFLLYPEISFAEALDLAVFSTVEETGTAVRFSLSRESVVRGFNRGRTAGDLWELLDRLSGGRADGALKWNLEDWGKRYEEVALYSGTVLVLSGERSFLSGALAEMVRKEIAPGVFLLNADRESAARALSGAGVDILAEPEDDEQKGRNALQGFFPEFGPGRPAEQRSLSAPENEGGEETGKSAEARPVFDSEKAERIKEVFRKSLEGRTPGKQEREELLARIGRRLIVSESQLSGVSIRYEKLEARSLDYTGKAAVAKQALESGSLIELHWTAGGKQTEALGMPLGLEKKGGETILVFRPGAPDSDGETADAVKIPLGKIGLIRRIKQSIFGE